MTAMPVPIQRSFIIQNVALCVHARYLFICVYLLPKAVNAELSLIIISYFILFSVSKIIPSKFIYQIRT